MIRSQKTPRLLAMAAIAAAAPCAVAPAAGAETFYITADRMLDVLEQRIVPDAAVVVVDDRITAVGREDALAVPDDAARIDLGDRTLLPGLIDMHVHLTASHEIQGLADLQVTDEQATILGVVHAARTLDAGFTTVRNAGAQSYADVALRDAIADGLIPGPRMFVSGIPIGITGGHCSDNNLLPEEWDSTGEGVANGPWEVREAVRGNVRYGADFIKICTTGGVLSAGTAIGGAHYTVEEIRAIVDEAAMHGMHVASHAHGAAGIRNALEAGVKTIEHASLIDDAGIQLARRDGAYLAMDIYVTEFILGEGEAAGILPESLEKERQVGQAQRESFSRAVAAGVNMLFATDAGVYPHGQNARQFSRMVEFGMTPMQAIRSATVNPSEVLGATADIGAVAVGRYADLIAVDGDPLQDIATLERVVFVMKGGELLRYTEDRPASGALEGVEGPAEP